MKAINGEDTVSVSVNNVTYIGTVADISVKRTPPRQPLSVTGYYNPEVNGKFEVILRLEEVDIKT